MPDQPKKSAIRYFGDYILLGEIARGGMGVVYHAVQASLDREVAIKMIDAGNLAGEAASRRFQTEAEAMAQLDHPNIVSIYEVGEHEGQCYLAMKLIEGNSLAEQIAEGRWKIGANNRKERQQAIARLMATVAGAVHHAHQRGVLHRDIKPGNILLDEEGEPHVTDFGLAKLTENDVGLSQTGAVLGTPSYMAPEQAAGKTRQITTATDVYAMGVVLYELLTGERPFHADDVIEILKMVVQQEPRRPRSHNPLIDPDLETICLKCLEKSSKNRYHTAEELANDLERWNDGKPILARPSTTAERVWKWVRRHPTISALLATLFLGAAVSAGAITWQWQRAERGWTEVRHSNTRLLLQRAEEQFAQDESSAALATLARALRDDSKNRVVEERLVNALSVRRFLIPLAARSESFDLGQSPQALARRAQRGSVSADAGTATNIVVSGQAVADKPFTLTPPRIGVIRHISLSSDTRWLAAAVADVGVCVWELRGRKLMGTFPHPSPAVVVEFNPAAAFVATGADDGKIRLWDLQRNELIREIPSHCGPVNAIRFTTNGVLISAGEDGVLRASYPESPRSEIEPLKLGDAIDELEFGSGNTLAVRLRGNVVRHFALPTLPSPRYLAAVDPKLADSTEPSLLAIDSVLGVAATNFHTQEIMFTNLSPDGRFVVTASMDGSARVWDAHTRQPATPPMVHGSTVNHARFSSDGRRIATSTDAQRVRVWDAATGVALTDALETQGDVFSVRFSENGRDVIASNGQRWTIHHGEQPAQFEWLPRLAEAFAGRRLSPAGVPESILHDEAAEFFRQLSAMQASDPQPDWLRALLMPP